MSITDVRVYLRNGTSSLRAFADLTLDGEFAVHDLKVVDGKKGLFVGMPGRKTPEGWKDVAFPVTRALRDQIQTRVLAAYREAAADPDRPAGR